MGSIHYNVWKCTNCDFTSKSVRAPYLVQPNVGTPESIIEFRWCRTCEKIQRVFIGVGKVIIPSQEPNSILEKWKFRTIEEFNHAVELLEIKRKRSFLFTFTSDAKLLKNYYESKRICEEVTKHNIAFYDRLRPKLTCLTCGGHDVSSLSYDIDKHSCGGNFIRENSSLYASGMSCEIVTYDADGSSIIEHEKISRSRN